ncbi:hypothetical protein M407DRAFT_27422 [Tulasnella calospora MUT 4182]|uniref:Uncharacterized protein n=1 Tax=Tulasnella calospora MUT 4182 TaxID=1051891 RepID=A0A0C3QDW6_9AGAM|nr:hypothetical protein M407DRAFT_27422 [Tulasnella calospora MUT 4182]
MPWVLPLTQPWLPVYAFWSGSKAECHPMAAYPNPLILFVPRLSSGEYRSLTASLTSPPIAPLILSRCHPSSATPTWFLIVPPPVKQFTARSPPLKWLDSSQTTALIGNLRLGDGVKYFMLEVEDWTQPAPQATSPRSPEASRPGQQRANSLSGSILPARSSPSNGTKARLVGRSVSDGGTVQGRLNGVDRTVGAGKSGPGEARTEPSAGVPPIAEKDTDTDDPKEGSSSKGLPVSSVGNRTSATTKNASPSPPSSPPTIRASTSLLSTSLRQPLPRPFNDSDDEDDRSQPLRHSMHSLARSPPGPFIPLLDPIIQGQRAPSPKRSTPNTAGLGRTSTSLVPSTPTTPTAEVSKVFVEGGTSPRLDKGKGKELPPSTTNTSTATGTPSTPSVQHSPRLGARADLPAPSLPPSVKQSKNQPPLSSSPLRVSRLAGESPSPSSSSTRSRARLSATPLAVPFSGRAQSGLAGNKRPLSVGMPGGFDQAMLSTSPPSASNPLTRDTNASVSNISKARASVAVISELESDPSTSTTLQPRTTGLSSVSENELNTEPSSTRPSENVSEAATSQPGGSSNLRGLNGGKGQRVETEEARAGGGGGLTSVARNVGNANTQTERRRTTSMMGTAAGGWLGGWGATFGRRSATRPTTSDNGGGDAGGVAALLKRYNEGT